MSLSRRKQQCSARTGFLDAVQAVPRLLDECLASVSDFDGIGGVRVFGWISTLARTLSLTAVTSYTMHLSLESEGSEQLSEVARLLKHGKLQRLDVNVITPLDPTKLKNYIPATERLKAFICSMGSALNHVTVLKLKISTSKLDHVSSSSSSSSSSNVAKTMEVGAASASTHMHIGSKISGKEDGEAPTRKHGGNSAKKRPCSKRKSSRSCKTVAKKIASGKAPPMDRSVMLDAEGAGLAAILAHTFPNLRSLIISDGVGSAALAVFGLQCNKLESLEFSHTFMTATLLQAAITHHLPHLTCISMTYAAVTCSGLDAAKRACLFKVVRSCAALTQLVVIDGVLCDPSEWVGLPPNLAELVCHDFPLGNMPKDVQLLNLKCLTVHWTAVGLTCTQVHTILHIAPNLKELSTVSGSEPEGCSVELNDSCTATDMLGWRSLYKRRHQGLELFNVHITINSPVTDTQDRICVEDAMQQMKAYPLKFFTHCKITNHHGGTSFYHHTCELELMRRVFPGLVTLELCGNWHDDVAMCGLRTGPHLTHLLWHGILKDHHNSGFFVDLIENNPSLINIKMESALGQEAKPTWVWNEMVDEYTPLTCGWGGLPFDPRDWIIQRTPSDEKLPKRGLQYLRKPSLTIEEV